MEALRSRNTRPNTDCLTKALAARGIDYRYLRRDEITVSYLTRKSILTFTPNGGAPYYFAGCFFVFDPTAQRVPGSMIDDGPTRYVLDSKELTKAALRSRGISVPEGIAVSRGARRIAESFFTVFAPALANGVCVKPVHGKWGHRVYVGIRDLPSFRAAFAAVAQNYKHILIEEAVRGTAYRFFCLAGRVIAIRAGIPSNIKGDGIHSIAQLIDIKNRQRQQSLYPAHAILRLGDQERELLERSGFSPAYVPDDGETIWLRTTSNLHSAVDIVDATDDVHSSYAEVVEQAVRGFSDPVLCGVDVMIQDVQAPAVRGNYHVLEMNLCPGFWAHHYPDRGKPRDVAGAIVDYLSNRCC